MIVCAERNVRRDYRSMGCSVGANDQRKIRDVTCRQSGVVRVIAFRCAAWVEVGSGRFEIRRLAFRELMDMQGMLARRQVLDVELDSYAMGRF